MSDDHFAFMIGGILMAIAVIWLFWPSNVPCERLVSSGRGLVGLPHGCFVDLRTSPPPTGGDR